MNKQELKKIKQHAINALFTESKSKERSAFTLIDKRLLYLNDRLTFNLFIQETPLQMTLFLQSNTLLDEQQQKRIERVENLYIDNDSKQNYDSYIENNLQRIVKDYSIDINEKTDLIYTSTTELTQSLYSNPEALENLTHSENIVLPVLDTIIHNENTIVSYMKIIEYDYYTHTHSLNVSIYALHLGAKLGLKESDLASLGKAALLHDLGKSKIEHAIVNKKGGLSDEEFMSIKMHPVYGYKLALKMGIHDKNILDGIRYHHEKLDGRGYPNGLKGSEITLFPRIIGVCDVFDALTTRRSYKKAMYSLDALRLMKEEMSTHLDQHIFHIFIKMLHR